MRNTHIISTLAAAVIALTLPATSTPAEAKNAHKSWNKHSYKHFHKHGNWHEKKRRRFHRSRPEDWYVKADGNPPFLGTKSHPFNSLADAETQSGRGDSIYVLPSKTALDGGIQLKDGQKLIGLGPKVTRLPTDAAHAQVSNTTATYLDGDAIRLANRNTVRNLHISGAYRSAILGINVVEPAIKDNLITENLIQHDLLSLQRDFVIFEPQRNHYAGITLFACGYATANECTDEDPSTKGIWNTGNVLIEGNVIRDSNVEGIVLLNDSGVIATYEVKNNYVHHLSQGLGDPLAELPTAEYEVVRSRGFTMISGNGAHVRLDMDGYGASHLAPEGDYASDGVVLVAFGENAVVKADISDVTVSNPDGTGEAVNGDSLEFSHFGSNNVFDLSVKRAFLSDSVSTLIKLLEVGPVNGNVTKFDIRDSVLTNENPRVFEPGVGRGAITYIKIPAPGADTVDTIDITVKNTILSGHIRGIHLMNINQFTAENVRVLVERSSFRNMQAYTDDSEGGEGVRVLNPGGDLGGAIVDLGGGPLGSDGQNSFTDNEGQDVSVLNFSANSVDVFASDNFWGEGGDAPAALDDFLIVPGSTATFTADTWLVTDPL